MRKERSKHEYQQVLAFIFLMSLIMRLNFLLPAVEGRTMFDIIQEYDLQLKVIVASVYPLHVQKTMIPKALAYHDKSHGSSSLLEKISCTI